MPNSCMFSIKMLCALPDGNVVNYVILTYWMYLYSGAMYGSVTRKSHINPNKSGLCLSDA